MEEGREKGMFFLFYWKMGKQGRGGFIKNTKMDHRSHRYIQEVIVSG